MKKQRIGVPAYRHIGLFGGTFNPIHIGHIKMAEAARKQFKLDVIYFIPCGIPPHKPTVETSGRTSLTAKLRYNLVKKAIRGKKYFKALDIEIKKKTPAYTIETIKKLKSQLTGRSSQLHFLIGQDEFEKLNTWYRINELAKHVHFLVLPRSNKKIKAPNVKDLNWSQVKTRPINISSTEIRRRIEYKFGRSYKASHLF